jgi:hypothetical protein
VLTLCESAICGVTLIAELPAFLRLGSTSGSSFHTAQGAGCSRIDVGHGLAKENWTDKESARYQY